MNVTEIIIAVGVVIAAAATFRKRHRARRDRLSSTPSEAE